MRKRKIFFTKPTILFPHAIIISFSLLSPFGQPSHRQLFKIYAHQFTGLITVLLLSQYPRNLATECNLACAESVAWGSQDYCCLHRRLFVDWNGWVLWDRWDILSWRSRFVGRNNTRSGWGFPQKVRPRPLCPCRRPQREERAASTRAHASRRDRAFGGWPD